VREHRALDQHELRFSLQTRDGTVERYEDTHIGEQQRILVRLQFPFAAHHLQCLLHVHRRRAVWWKRKKKVSHADADGGGGGTFQNGTYTEMVVYRCAAASAVSWMRMRRNICGPDGLYDPGKIELLSVDESSAPALVLGAIAAGGTSVELPESGFLVLAATRDGLRWMLLSRILFCFTGGLLSTDKYS
jgi:hypothetical protein